MGQRAADSRASHEIPSICEVSADPTASVWLKTALRSALCRDPVDAADDPDIPARKLERRCNQIRQTGKHSAGVFLA
jgi:hypothetical protein